MHVIKYWRHQPYNRDPFFLIEKDDFSVNEVTTRDYSIWKRFGLPSEANHVRDSKKNVCHETLNKR